jgi:hypothetical protein
VKGGISHALRSGFGGQTSGVALAGEASPRVNSPRSSRCTLTVAPPFVSKWLRRLRQADPVDVLTLHSHSRERHPPPTSIASQPPVVQRILEIRVAPPEHAARASRGQRRFCTTCSAILRSNRLVCAYHVGRPPFGRSYARQAVSNKIIGASPSL